MKSKQEIKWPNSVGWVLQLCGYSSHMQDSGLIPSAEKPSQLNKYVASAKYHFSSTVDHKILKAWAVKGRCCIEHGLGFIACPIVPESLFHSFFLLSLIQEQGTMAVIFFWESGGSRSWALE